ncbi:MAG TPA: hypothetical protein VKP30_06770 [Polyangiaceae bacterium]|nr:hypothetical protein [Polyangiaceae bacterium]
MMDQLDSVLSQLRNGYSPDGAARRRVRSALTTSLAVGAVLGTANLKATAAAIGSTAGAKSVSLGKLLFFGKVVVGLGATATATVAGVQAVRSFDQAHESRVVTPHTPALSSSRGEHGQASIPRVPVSEAATVGLASAPTETMVPKQPVAPELGERKREGTARPKNRESLRPASSSVDEFRLLREASQDLRGGRVADAQRKLEEHSRRFPTTSLGDERRGLSLVASCSAGSTKQNRAEAAHFVEVAPSSPLADSVRRRCIQ